VRTSLTEVGGPEMAGTVLTIRTMIRMVVKKTKLKLSLNFIILSINIEVIGHSFNWQIKKSPSESEGD